MYVYVYICVYVCMCVYLYVCVFKYTFKNYIGLFSIKFVLSTPV